jgi:hypothetical protein
MRHGSKTDMGYSPDGAEILDRKPRWIIRRGMFVVGLIFALSLLGTWFIPYPERLNCNVTIPNSAVRPADSAGFYGTIRLPSEYASVIAAGMEVKIFLAVTGEGDPITAMGNVEALETDTTGRFLNLLSRFHTDPGTALKFISAGQANAQIFTGNSNLLHQIFHPIISVIKGAGQNQKQPK